MSPPDPRTIRRALATLERLPTEALADLTERLVDRLDAADLDPDLEPETDACEAGECGGVSLRGDCLPGDPTDAEPNGDEQEPDDDVGATEDEPNFPTLRAERDGFVTVHRRPFVLVTSKNGRPVRVQTVIAERRR
jgi:hypothetical protein